MTAIILALAISAGIGFYMVGRRQSQADRERGLELARWRAVEERLGELEAELRVRHE